MAKWKKFAQFAPFVYIITIPYLLLWRSFINLLHAEVKCKIFEHILITKKKRTKTENHI